MTARLFSGWSFPETCLHPIADALPADTPDCAIAWSLGGLQILSSPIAPCPLILLSSTARFCGDETGWPGLPAANLRALKKLFRRDPALALRQFHRLCAGPSPCRYSFGRGRFWAAATTLRNCVIGGGFRAGAVNSQLLQRFSACRGSATRSWALSRIGCSCGTFPWCGWCDHWDSPTPSGG